HDLAMIANEPSALPVYAPIYAGTPAISDNAQITSVTILQHLVPRSPQEGFNSEAMNPQLQRQDVENWSLDPIIVPEKLEAMRAACQWVIYGPERANRDNPGLLFKADDFPPEDRNRHFGVADQLAMLPSNWLHFERRATPPIRASFRARW